MDEFVYVTTRIPEALKSAFQEALEKDGRQYTISQIIRYWIERFVIDVQDQGLSRCGELEKENVALRQEVKSNKESIQELMKLVDKLFEAYSIKVKND